MNPIVDALQFYDKSCETTLNDDLRYYLTRGYVYSGEDTFIMARPITRRYAQFVLDERFTYKPKEYDTWFCYLAVGKLERFLELAPFKLQWILFHRQEKDEKDRWYTWKGFERAIRITKNEQSKKT